VIRRKYFWLRARFRQLMRPKAISQPVPQLSGEDVIRVIRRDFSSEQIPGVQILLEDYAHGKWSREYPRVQLAALKLAKGNLDALRTAISTAKQDYRDVLAPAEYPEYMKAGMFRVRDLPAQEQRRIVEGDWKQYQDWLKAD
jgi:hypothetical protein